MSQKLNSIFGLKEIPFVLVVLISIFAWIFNNWAENISKEPRVIYRLNKTETDSSKLIYYDIINIGRSSFEDLKFSVCDDNIEIIGGAVEFKQPYYQGEDQVPDFASQVCANFNIVTLNPKSRCKLFVEYECDGCEVNPILRFESVKNDKAIIIKKIDFINYILIHNDRIGLIILILILVTIIYYFIWYGIKSKI